MRIAVVSAFEASSHWAHAINTVKMAQGFAQLGHEVTIICYAAADGEIQAVDLGRLYGIGEPLHWIQLGSRILGRRVKSDWHFALRALLHAWRLHPDLVFCRNYTFPWLSGKVGIPTVGETHAAPDNRTRPFLRFISGTHHRAFQLVVTISPHLADFYQSLGVPKEKVLVLPDAVDLSLFSHPSHLPPSKFPVDERPNAVYAGHLYDYKGIPTILEAASLLPDVNFHLVGGWPEDIARHKAYLCERKLHNVILHGFQPHAEIPVFLWHADVLLLPPSANHPSALWTSPVKLGEYLASGTPVVATSIPALRYWLTDDEVRFVEPDNAHALAAGIVDVLKNPDYANNMVQAALKKAQTLSYTRRAEAILERLNMA